MLEVVQFIVFLLQPIILDNETFCGENGKLTLEDKRTSWFDKKKNNRLFLDDSGMLVLCIL